MKRISLLFIALAGLVFASSNAMAIDGKLSADRVRAGDAIGVAGRSEERRVGKEC